MATVKQIQLQIRNAKAKIEKLSSELKVVRSKNAKLTLDLKAAKEAEKRPSKTKKTPAKRTTRRKK